MADDKQQANRDLPSILNFPSTEPACGGICKTRNLSPDRFLILVVFYWPMGTSMTAAFLDLGVTATLVPRGEEGCGSYTCRANAGQGCRGQRWPLQQG